MPKRSPEVEAFLKEIAEVCTRHSLILEAEEYYGDPRLIVEDLKGQHLDDLLSTSEDVFCEKCGRRWPLHDPKFPGSRICTKEKALPAKS